MGNWTNLPRYLVSPGFLHSLDPKRPLRASHPITEHASREAGEDRRGGRAPWPLRHFPARRGRGAATPLRRHTAPDRRPATGPSTAMTALDPVASRSPDRTGVCHESRGAPSAPGLVIGSGFRSPNRPDKGRNPIYRAGSRLELWCERTWCYHRRQLEGTIWGISVQL